MPFLRAAELVYSVMIRGQFAIWALICLMTGEPGPPAVALLTDSGSFPTRIALKIWSAVAGSVRCGSGVITGVGTGVATATDGGGALPHAAAMTDTATRSTRAGAPRLR